MNPIPIPQTCPRCRGTEVLFLPSGEKSLAAVCECVAECRQCQGAGRLFREKDGALFAEPCSCRSRQRRVELYNRANIPAHFHGKGFGSFQTYETLGPVRQRVESFAQGYPNFGKGVLLWGKPGTGKTHLLTAALQYLTLERGIPARYVEFSFLISEIKEAFMRNVSALVALAPLADVEVLAIDELGKGRSTEFEREVLDELIGRRLAERITAQQLAALRELLDAMDSAAGSGDVKRYHKLNLDFHDALVGFVGNSRLKETYRRLTKELLLFRLRGLKEGGGLAVSNAEHKAIVRAIAARDPERAGRVLRAHAADSRARMHKAAAKESPWPSK